VVPHNSPNVNIIFTSTLDEEADNVFSLFIIVSRNPGVSVISNYLIFHALMNVEYVMLMIRPNVSSGVK
jgi:hypothetical protein